MSMGLAELIKEINEKAETFIINPPVIISKAMYRFIFCDPRRYDRFERDDVRFDPNFNRECYNLHRKMWSINRFKPSRPYNYTDRTKFDRERRFDRFKRVEFPGDEQ